MRITNHLSGGYLVASPAAKLEIKRTKEHHSGGKYPADYSEKFLLATDGDGSEPKKLCKGSLVVVRSTEFDGLHEVVFTGLEMDDLCAQWLKARNKKSKS